MKLAIISDIHGNYDALVEVLKKAKKEGVMHLLILGDIVGYYYHPDKILKALSEWDFDIVKGNHEYILEEIIAQPSLKESIRLKYGSGHKYALDKLSNEELSFLKSLPDTKSIKLDETSMLLCHGSPWSNDFYVYPDCDSDIIERCNSLDHDFVFIGHSHYAFAIKSTNSIIINPGSVGQSRQIGGKAFWCILNTENKCFQMMSTDYNTDKILDEVKGMDPDIKYLSEILKRK